MSESTEQLINTSISVIIPAYNAESTILETIASVKAQTLKPDEILVLDDGSSDKTVNLVREEYPEAMIIQQQNMGIGGALNSLYRALRGTLIARIDSDDLWHPRYLEAQVRLHQQYPNAIASFVGHQDFVETLPAPQAVDIEDLVRKAKLVEPFEFLNTYHGFHMPTFSVIKKKVLQKIGVEPYPHELKRCDDIYLWYCLALCGPVVEVRFPLGGYRLRSNSLSYDLLSLYVTKVDVVKKVLERYKTADAQGFIKIATRHLSSTYRLVAKYQMGVYDVTKARKCLLNSLAVSPSLKSLLMLLLTYMPKTLQPHWPKRWRQA